ncbi:hypothetical protein PsorP6_004088 [Peronosclerospora sorghi]|uniref:Uncharacterized protein n=1 Tax=Peronosclerospora sorghi TaxID=230839 RepID=A0ACC0VQN7_9STRA|nr:hypothetical protein PsorP6_004088 [Peronosclerospora sorghi]
MTWVGVAYAVAALMVPLVLHRIFFYKRVNHDNSAGSCSLEENKTKVRFHPNFTHSVMTFGITHGMSDLDAKFQLAVDFIAARGSNNMTSEQKSTLYALYKQAHFGKCSMEKPSAVDMVGLSKLESWKAISDMDQNVAKKHYVEWVQDLFDEFDCQGPKRWRSSYSSSSKTTSETESLDSNTSMVGSVSMPKVDMSTDDWKVHDGIFHYASTGELGKMVDALDQGEDINAHDFEGRTMMHWAVDRDQMSVVEELLRRKASPNIQDADGMTPLHYAAICEHEEMAHLLVCFHLISQLLLWRVVKPSIHRDVIVCSHCPPTTTSWIRQS